MSDSTDTPTLPAVIRAAISERLADMHVCMPGRVTSYVAATQECAVQPLLKVRRRGEDGEEVVETLPVIDRVPVVFPGAGAYSITFPISVGDTVLLVFSESSLDSWLVTGGLIDPNDPRRFALTDAIAIPGLRAFKAPITPAPPSNKIKIGLSDADDPVARKSDLDAVIDAVDARLVAHTHASNGANGVVTAGLISKPGCCPTVVVD